MTTSPFPDALAELVLVGYHDFRRRFTEVTRRELHGAPHLFRLNC